MKALFDRQDQLETMTKVCRNSYLSSCMKAIVYGLLLTVLISSWQTGEAFFILDSYSEETAKFMRGWATFGYILLIAHLFIQLEQIPKYLDVLKSEDPKYDLKGHLDCMRWLGVVFGFTAGFLVSFWLTHEISTMESRFLLSSAGLMLIMMVGIGKDCWRMSGLSPAIAEKIDNLCNRYIVARNFCKKTLEHRPFVDVDFDLLTKELHRQAVI